VTDTPLPRITEHEDGVDIWMRRAPGGSDAVDSTA